MNRKKPNIVRVYPETKKTGAIPGIKRGTRKPHSVKKPSDSQRKLNIVKELKKPSSDSVYIIGGGPSLRGFDFSRLEGHDTIAVNKAIEYVESATYFVTMDYSFFQKASLSIPEINKKVKESYFILNTWYSYIQRVNGVYTDTRDNFQYLDLHKMSAIVKAPYELYDNGFSKSVNTFAHGSNSGYSAIQLAILMGYKNIYLLGFDMNVDEHSHFHSGYKQSQSRFSKNIKHYKNNLIQSLKNLTGVNIFSCSEHSKLNVLLKYSSVDDTLKKGTKMENKTSTRPDDLVIVAYYTVNTPYELEAAKLEKSLTKLGLNYDIVGVPNLGDWQANTRFKAQFMLDMLDKHIGKNLVYVDSDAIVHSLPILFENYNCDVAVRWQDFRWRKNECLSGTIFMANNQKTRDLCLLWQKTNVAEGTNAKTFEQWNLGSAIQQMKKSHGLRDKNLPPEYTFIFDSMRKIYPDARPVIEHFQASRRFKNKV